MPPDPHPFLDALHRYSRIGSGRVRPSGSDAGSDSGTPAVLRHLPTIGLMVALVQILVYALTSLLLPHPVAVLLTLAAGALLTGAVHERGWMVWCESASTAATTSTELASTNPTHAGTVGLVLILLLRFVTLVHIEADWLAAALVCAATISRGVAVAVTAQAPRLGTVGLALLVALAPCAALAAWTGDASTMLTGLGCAVLAAGVMRGMSRRRGRDNTLSAVQQVAEVACLIGMLAVLEAADLDTETDDSES